MFTLREPMRPRRPVTTPGFRRGLHGRISIVQCGSRAGAVPRLAKAPVTAMLPVLMAALLLALMLGSPAHAQFDREARLEARRMLEGAYEVALDEIERAAHGDDAALRANAIEAMQPVPSAAAELAERGLDDPNPAVRFSALVTVGELELVELSEAALMLRDDPQPSVRAAALYAGRACGRDVDLTPLANMLAARDPSVRSNAAMLLGLLGDGSAAPMLKELAHAPMPRVSAVRQALVRIQIAEALVELGEDGALDALRAGAYSHHDEVRVLAVQALGRTGDRQMEAALAQLVTSDEPIELRLAAAEALARMGGVGEAGLTVMREGAGWDDPPVRAQAAFCLGHVVHPAALGPLLTLLAEDDSAQVRLSAAAAVLRAHAEATAG